MRRATTDELSEFKREAFRNAVRLFLDACLLFERRRFPSAYAVGVLAYEELGKVYAIDWVCDAMSLNPESAEQLYDDMIAGGWLSDHRHKQRRVHADTAMWSEGLDSPKTNFIHSGGLEETKQQALYVELSNTRVLTPSRISWDKAAGLLKDVLQAFEESGDIGFNGYDHMSTEQSQWQAEELVHAARKAFAEATKGCSHPG